MAKTRTLTIRNVPDAVVRTFRRRARISGRSMQQELLTVLKKEAIDRESALAQLLELRRRHLVKPMSIAAIQAAIGEGRP